jgi:hypothetical protein
MAISEVHWDIYNSTPYSVKIQIFGEPSCELKPQEKICLFPVQLPGNRFVLLQFSSGPYAGQAWRPGREPFSSEKSNQYVIKTLSYCMDTWPLKWTELPYIRCEPVKM